MPQNDNVGYGAGAGGLAGAGIGAFFGNPMLGASLGSSLGGAAGSMFGSSGVPQVNQTDLNNNLNRRIGQIQGYQQQLSQARANYSNQLNRLQNLTFQRFMPMEEAQFAGRGLSANGGAYQSALARQAAMLQAQGSAANAQGQIEDLNNAQNAFNQAYGQGSQAYSQAAGQNLNANLADWQNNNQNVSGLGGYAAALLQARTMQPQGPQVVSPPQQGYGPFAGQYGQNTVVNPIDAAANKYGWRPGQVY